MMARPSGSSLPSQRRTSTRQPTDAPPTRSLDPGTPLPREETKLRDSSDTYSENGLPIRSKSSGEPSQTESNLLPTDQDRGQSTWAQTNENGDKVKQTPRFRPAVTHLWLLPDASNSNDIHANKWHKAYQPAFKNGHRIIHCLCTPTSHSQRVHTSRLREPEWWHRDRVWVMGMDDDDDNDEVQEVVSVEWKSEAGRFEYRAREVGTFGTGGEEWFAAGQMRKA